MRVTLVLSLLISVLLSTIRHTEAQTQGCFVEPDGVVAWWPGDVDAQDIGGTNHGTLLNGAQVGSGFVSQGFNLDGDDDYIDVGDRDSLDFGLNTDFSIHAWVKTSGSPHHSDHQNVVDKRSVSTSQGYILSVSPNGKVTSSVGNNTIRVSVISNASVDDGLFHHIATVFDRDGASSVYIDGELDSFADMSHVGDVSNPGVLTIGRGNINNPPSIHKAFSGVIDEIQILNEALTAAEIAAIYEAGSAGICKDEDGDGFRPLEDCDETDPTINPDGTELPGNFIDEDCNGDLGDCSPCNSWRNHGEYLRCVSQAVELLVAGGALTQEEGDALVSSAARSDVGKKGFVPPECE